MAGKGIHDNVIGAVYKRALPATPLVALLVVFSPRCPAGAAARAARHRRGVDCRARARCRRRGCPGRPRSTSAPFERRPSAAALTSLGRVAVLGEGAVGVGPDVLRVVPRPGACLRAARRRRGAARRRRRQGERRSRRAVAALPAGHAAVHRALSATATATTASTRVRSAAAPGTGAPRRRTSRRRCRCCRRSRWPMRIRRRRGRSSARLGERGAVSRDASAPHALDDAALAWNGLLLGARGVPAEPGRLLSLQQQVRRGAARPSRARCRASSAAARFSKTRRRATARCATSARSAAAPFRSSAIAACSRSACRAIAAWPSTPSGRTSTSACAARGAAT